jgi:hypothetical protein
VTEGVKGYRHAIGVLHRTVGDRVILNVSDQDRFDEISGSGSVVWQLLDVSRTTSEVVELVAEIFGVPADSVRTEVRDLLVQLADRRALEVAADDG